VREHAGGCGPYTITVEAATMKSKPTVARSVACNPANAVLNLTGDGDAWLRRQLDGIGKDRE